MSPKLTGSAQEPPWFLILACLHSGSPGHQEPCSDNAISSMYKRVKVTMLLYNRSSRVENSFYKKKAVINPGKNAEYVMFLK